MILRAHVTLINRFSVGMGLAVAVIDYLRGSPAVAAITLAYASFAAAILLAVRRAQGLAGLRALAHATFGAAIALIAAAAYLDVVSPGERMGFYTLLPILIAASLGARAAYQWTAVMVAAVIAVHALLVARGHAPDVELMRAALHALQCVSVAGFAGTLRVLADRRADEAASARACSEEAARALESTNVALAAALRARDAFLANMSHEIRTPMHAILGLSDELLDGRLEGGQRECATAIRTAGEGLLVIINDILDLSKIESGRMELERVAFDPRALVDETLSLVACAARAKGVALHAEVAPEVPAALRGDPVRVRQVLLNLLSNAVKFTARGEVAVRVSAGPGARGARPVTLRVRDTGVGLRPEDRARIFDAFTQADASTTRRFGGTGLGLTITRRLVELMGGVIVVESELGRGSEFSVCAPFEEAAPAASATPRSPSLPPPPRRVLVAEDNPVNQRIIERALRQLACDVTLTANGAEALAALEGGAYDLVFMDCQMPELDGYDATRAIRARERAEGRAPVPIVALTASAFESDRARCLDAGMNAHVAKPFRRAELREAIVRWAATPASAAAGGA